MNRIALIKAIQAMGCESVRHGAKHDWYRNPSTRELQAVLRHREIKAHLAKKILQSLRNAGEGTPVEGNDA